MCEVIIAIAGFEGALPSAISGLVPAHIIAVPTSIGYGVGLGGFAALMTMLRWVLARSFGGQHRQWLGGRDLCGTNQSHRRQ